MNTCRARNHRAALESQPTAKSEKVRALREQWSRIQPQTDEQLAQITANYYGMISFIDNGVGRIFESLESNGLADNTIVLFTSNHGELLGDHGLYLKGPTHYEALLRVGLIASGPVIAPITNGTCIPAEPEWRFGCGRYARKPQN